VRNNFLSVTSGYKAVISAKDPSSLAPPVLLKDFLHLLILKTLRPEKLYICVLPLLKFTPQHCPLTLTFEQSSNKRPIIFILSPGADAQNLFQKFEETVGVQGLVLSMGQGQSQKAMQVVLKARKEGQWVFLQNCHLSISWLEDYRRIDQ